MCGGGCSHHRTGLSLQSFIANEVNDSGLFELDPQRNRKRRALALADNKIGENAGWDRELLAIELPALAEILVVERSRCLNYRFLAGRDRPAHGGLRGGPIRSG